MVSCGWTEYKFLLKKGQISNKFSGGGIEIFGHERHLKIAKQHLSYIETNAARRKGRAKIGYDRYPIDMDPALVVSIFSALAVEASVNMFIEERMLLFADTAEKEFSPLAGWIMGGRYNIRKRIELINLLSPELKLDYTKDGFKELFEYRNRWVHYKGDYFEGFVEFVNPKDSKVKKKFMRHISYNGVSSEDIKKAKEHYKLAVSIIKKLELPPYLSH
jgi:hypothetical protein